MVISFHHLSTVTFCNLRPNKCLSVQSESLLLFFSLHTASNELLYVSEQAEYETNASFGAICLPDYEKNLGQICVKLWGLRHNSEQYSLLYNVQVNLRDLVCMRNASQGFESSQIIDNSMIFGLQDVSFVVRSDLRVPIPSPTMSIVEYAKSKLTVPRSSYTYDDVRRLCSLSNGINDFAASESKLCEEIDRIEEEFLNASTQEKLRSLKVHLHDLHKYVAKQHSLNDELLSSIWAKERQVKALLSCLKDEIPPKLELIADKLDIVKSEVAPIFEALQFSIYPDLVELLRTICGVIREVFPIHLDENGCNYSIAHINFPANILVILTECYEPQFVMVGSTSESSVERINAGLSVIVHLLLHLSSLLDIKLKYGIVQNKSHYFLVEMCSLFRKVSNANSSYAGEFDLVEARYPLFYDAAGSEKIAKVAGPVKSYELKNQNFERALLLLKKNVIAFSSDVMDLYSKYLYGKMEVGKLTNNIPVECIDNFVWTINYLLLFMTAPLP